MDVMNAAVSEGLNQAVRASSRAIWSPKGPPPAVHQPLVESGHFLSTYYSDEDGAVCSLRPGGFSVSEPAHKTIGFFKKTQPIAVGFFLS